MIEANDVTFRARGRKKGNKNYIVRSTRYWRLPGRVFSTVGSGVSGCTVICGDSNAWTRLTCVAMLGDERGLQRSAQGGPCE